MNKYNAWVRSLETDLINWDYSLDIKFFKNKNKTPPRGDFLVQFRSWTILVQFRSWTTGWRDRVVLSRLCLLSGSQLCQKWVPQPALGAISAEFCQKSDLGVRLSKHTLRSVVLKCLHASESSGGLVKTQSAESQPQGLWFSLSRVGPENLHFSFNWRIIALLCCVGFCQTSTGISHRYAYSPTPLKFPPTLPHILPL